jgi:hypothetical protein
MRHESEKWYGKTYKKESYCIIICNGSVIVCLSCTSNPLQDQGVTILSPKANYVV